MNINFLMNYYSTVTMAASSSQVKVRKALESTESLLTSLVERSNSLLPSSSSYTALQSSSAPNLTPANGAGGDINITDGGISTGGAGERECFNVEQSLIGTGEAQPMLSEPLNENTEPSNPSIDTLSSLVCRSIISASQEMDPDYLQEQLYQVEKDLQLSAKIGLALSRRVGFLEREVTRLTEQSSSLDRNLKQARHELASKESLLSLYYVQADQEEEKREGEEEKVPEWAQTLSEENNQLKKANQELWEEKVRLEQEAESNAQTEKAFVQQCVKQLTEAKEQLLEFQTAMEAQEEKTHQLQVKLGEYKLESESLKQSKFLLIEENEDLKEKIIENQTALTHAFMELSEWHEKYDSVYTLLKNVQEENKVLKELTDTSNDGSITPSEGEHHESIVKEIEEVLRRELVAASTLTDRPVSPNNYAVQRTNVVMETVKAATLATARKLEMLAAEQRKKEEDMSQKTSSLVSEDELLKGVNNPHAYFSPQKLQIVKPMEGSITLLRWKLLATPQLRGTSGFLEVEGENQAGIHLKNYSSNSRPTTPQEIKATSDSPRRWHSVYNLSSQNQSPNAPLQKMVHRRHQPLPSSLPHGGKKMAASSGASQLSTVGKVKQNILGFISPSGENKKRPTVNGEGGSESGSGLQELLSF